MKDIFFVSSWNFMTFFTTSIRFHRATSLIHWLDFFLLWLNFSAVFRCESTASIASANRDICFFGWLNDSEVRQWHLTIGMVSTYLYSLQMVDNGCTITRPSPSKQSCIESSHFFRYKFWGIMILSSDIEKNVSVLRWCRKTRRWIRTWELTLVGSLSCFTLGSLVSNQKFRWLDDTHTHTHTHQSQHVFVAVPNQLSSC